MFNVADSFFYKPSKRPRKSIRCIHVPSDLILTPRVLLGTLLKLPTIDIQKAVDVLIDELDIRCGNPDLEYELVS